VHYDASVGLIVGVCSIPLIRINDLKSTGSMGVKDEHCIAQKDAGPSQVYSGGFIIPQLYAIL